MRKNLLVLALVALSSLCSLLATPASHGELKQQVKDTERAFAQTMARRDHLAFASFLSEEAIFFSGDKPLHGKQEIAKGWRRFFEKPEAPFSWEPESVEVLDSGNLALSTGPVHDSKGRLIGTFTSIWRLEEPGKWRIVFDKGSPGCGKP
ncbi:YybH family protein [Geothrix campi]|uniref:YybH family protein n=1 Tax=Geothrix campi TaxID=2966450 RepID=UPI0021483B4E|nr:nuclear transport factor 2 family protein [Geothrix sp. SG10]